MRSGGVQVGFWKDMKREGEEDEAAHAALGAELAREYPDFLPLLAARVASLAALQGDKRTARLQARASALFTARFPELPAVPGRRCPAQQGWKAAESECECVLTRCPES